MFLNHPHSHLNCSKFHPQNSCWISGLLTLPAAVNWWSPDVELLKCNFQMGEQCISNGCSTDVTTSGTVNWSVPLFFNLSLFSSVIWLKTHQKSTYCAHSYWLRVSCFITFTVQCFVSLHFQTCWGFVCISNLWKYTTVLFAQFNDTLLKQFFFIYIIPVCHLTQYILFTSGTNHKLPYYFSAFPSFCLNSHISHATSDCITELPTLTKKRHKLIFCLHKFCFLIVNSLLVTTAL
jgi:hypothetical protein